MDILVFSDSHGRVENIREALQRQLEVPYAVLFLGDGLGDLKEIDFKCPVYAVCGNCDFRSWIMPPDEPDERLIMLAGKRIMMTHGHKYSVKSGLARAIYAAADREADILLFGHTHEKMEMFLPKGTNLLGTEIKKDLYVMNPGSIGGYPSSFGCISIDGCGRILLSHG